MSRTASVHCCADVQLWLANLSHHLHVEEFGPAICHLQVQSPPNADDVEEALDLSEAYSSS